MDNDELPLEILLRELDLTVSQGYILSIVIIAFPSPPPRWEKIKIEVERKTEENYIEIGGKRP